MVLTNLSTQYWELMLSQGVLVGIGNGCLFIPSFAVLPTYFKKRRAVAVGIAQSGSALGSYTCHTMVYNSY
jgi:MFS family permease